MTDKDKIREEVQRLMNELIQEKERGFGSDTDDACILELQNVLTFIDSLQEEPVSEELEKVSQEWLRPQLDKSYAKYGETKMMELTHFDGYAMLEAIEFGAKWKEEQFEKNRKEPVSEELEEEIDRAHRIFYDEVGWDSDEGARAYVADWFAHYFANWQKHHMEANRLAHCNSITNEQAELEQGFIDQHLDKYNRMPTYLDAIEYGMAKEKENIKKSPYLCGYVARDKNGLLHVFEMEPRRLEDYWWDMDFMSAIIAHDAFPDLKWEDEPIYVRLLIVKGE